MSDRVGEEEPSPSESVGGFPVVKTVGFSSGMDITLGVPPVTAALHSSRSYSTQISQQSVWWHPIFVQ
jgi:hypothetical protein